MEKLRLPSPANALFQSVHSVLDELIRPVSPSGSQEKRLLDAMLLAVPR